jgi:hypothetical protein
LKNAGERLASPFSVSEENGPVSGEDKDKEKDNDKDKEKDNDNDKDYIFFSLSRERAPGGGREKNGPPLGRMGFGGGRKPLAKMPHRVYNMLFNGVKGPGV